MSFVKRGNLKRSKLATGRPVNETNYIGGGIGEGTPMEKDSTSTIANATHAQGNIEILQCWMPRFYSFIDIGKMYHQIQLFTTF